MNSGRILVNGSSFYCGNSTSGLCQLALKTDIPEITQYVHPTEKQCNYVYTHPSIQQCSNVNAISLNGHTYNDITSIIASSQPIIIEKVYTNQPKNEGDSYFPSNFNFTNLFAVMIGTSGTITQTGYYNDNDRWEFAIRGAMDRENSAVSTATPEMTSAAHSYTVSKLNSLFWRCAPMHGDDPVTFISASSNTSGHTLDDFIVWLGNQDNDSPSITVSNITVTVTAFRFNIQ